MKETLKEIMEELEDLRAKDAARVREISELKAEQSELDRPRIFAYGANLIAKFLDMEEKTGKAGKSSTDNLSTNSPSHATTRYTRAATNFDSSKFKSTGLPDHCFKLLKKYPEKDD
ncbi:hypothetical protein MMC07_006793 [Pseudocyphellaria aurata]|nr:hypothetical protein [Pseudocyphellaria aurata]